MLRFLFSPLLSSQGFHEGIFREYVQKRKIDLYSTYRCNTPQCSKGKIVVIIG